MAEDTDSRDESGIGSGEGYTPEEEGNEFGGGSGGESAKPTRRRRRSRAEIEAAGETPSAQINVTERAPRKGKGADAPEITQSAQLLITLANNIAVAKAGPEAALTPQESMLVGTGLKHSIAAVPAKAVKKIVPIMGPAIMIGGLVMWSMRIADLSRRQQRTLPQQETSEAAGGIPNAVPQADVSMNGPVTAAPPGEYVRNLIGSDL